MTSQSDNEMSSDNAVAIIVAGIQTGQLKFPFGNNLDAQVVKRFIEERICKEPPLERISELCQDWKFDDVISQVARADAIYFRELFFALTKEKA